MQGCNGLSSLQMIRSSYSSRAPLDSTANDPIARFPNYHDETSKIEKLSRAKPLPCTWSTWARWWRSWLPQVGPPFLIALARWRLDDYSPIVHYAWATLRHIFTSPLSPQWTASFKHLISSRWYTWTCTRQSWWRSPLDVILSMGCMISSSWRKPMETYLTPHRLSHRPWDSTQSAMDNAYHTMGSLDPSRYIFYSLWVDQLDSLLT